MARFARRLRRAALLAVGLALLMPPSIVEREALAQPAKHPKGDPDHKHEAPNRPTPEQIEKRLERIKKRAEERRRNRVQRVKDRRKALRRQLHKLLDGGPIPAEVKSELGQHARRTAQLRRVRDIAAEKADYDSVELVDKLLARENARHDAWMRGARKLAQKKKEEGAKP